MHSLRGALAVAMIGNGAPMPVISAVLGHASSDTTQAYYLRFDTERLRCCALDAEDVTGQAGAGVRGGWPHAAGPGRRPGRLAPPAPRPRQRAGKGAEPARPPLPG